MFINKQIFSIKEKLALVITIQRFSPTNVDKANTLIRNPKVPIIIPKNQLNHQFLDFNHDHPNQKDNRPYGNKNKGPLIGPIRIINKKNWTIVPSKATFVPLLKCKSAIGKGSASLNKAPPTGK